MHLSKCSSWGKTLWNGCRGYISCSCNLMTGAPCRKAFLLNSSQALSEL